MRSSKPLGRSSARMISTTGLNFCRGTSRSVTVSIIQNPVATDGKSERFTIFLARAANRFSVGVLAGKSTGYLDRLNTQQCLQMANFPANRRIWSRSCHNVRPSRSNSVSQEVSKVAKFRSEWIRIRRHERDGQWVGRKPFFKKIWNAAKISGPKALAR